MVDNIMCEVLLAILEQNILSHLAPMPSCVVMTYHSFTRMVACMADLYASIIECVLELNTFYK